MIAILSVIVVLYLALIASLTLGLRWLPAFEPVDSESETSFSIVVVFRNEKDQLPDLIHHLGQLNYPSDKFEVLLVNDGSDDGSVEIVKSLQKNTPALILRILELEKESRSPKKEALELGAREASYDWIITTDADCMMGPDYLSAYDQFLKKQPARMVAGPVICEAGDSFLHRFQALDFLSLQGSTMGGFGARDSIPFIRPFMCNGANLCYDKKTFRQLGGYEGNKDIASGDDVFLLEKMLDKHESEVRFIKSKAALIRTRPKETWKSLIEQRKRWAAKSTSYKNGFARLVGLLVILTNLSLLAGLFLGVSGSASWSHLGILFVMKINLDFVLIYNTAPIGDQQEVMKSFVTSSLLYPFFVVWVALQSLTGNYVWKGRTYKK